MNYKMIISDYDGTTAIGNKIPKEVVGAIKAFRNAGGKFVFCTGRAEASILSVMKENGVEADAVISYQGSKVNVNGDVILSGGIDKQTVLDLIDDFRKFNKGVVLFLNDEIFYEGSDGVERYVEFYRPFVNCGKMGDLKKFVQGSDLVYQKLIITKTPEEDVSAIESYIDEKYNGKILVNSGGVRLLECVSTKFSKYVASKLVAEHFNISESEVITVGDSTNDLTLLEYGFGVAVENAHETLKESADFIAPHVDKFPLKFIVDKVLSGNNF